MNEHTFDNSSFQSTAFKKSFAQESFQSTIFKKSFAEKSFHQHSFNKPSLAESSLEASSFNQRSFEESSFAQSSLEESSLKTGSFEQSSFETNSLELSDFEATSFSKSSFPDNSLADKSFAQLRRTTFTPELAQLKLPASQPELDQLQEPALEKAASSLELQLAHSSFVDASLLGGPQCLTTGPQGGVLKSTASYQLDLDSLTCLLPLGAQACLQSFQVKGSFLPPKLSKNTINTLYFGTLLKAKNKNDDFAQLLSGPR